jgi:hypothetical protein
VRQAERAHGTAVAVSAGRRRPRGLGELCEDDRERELLAGTRTKAERQSPPGYPLRLYLADLAL